MQSQTMAVNYEGVQRLDIRDHQKLVQKLARQVFYIRIEQVKIGWYYVWQPLSSYIKKNHEKGKSNTRRLSMCGSKNTDIKHTHTHIHINRKVL